MNKNFIIGVLVAIVVIGGGYAIYAAVTSPSAPASQTATYGAPNVPVTGPVTPGVPIVVTDSGSVFASNATALVTGSVVPEGAPTSYWYEYGATEALGTRTATQAVGSGWNQIPAPEYISGLAPNTEYFFRLDASNSYGSVTGETHSFMTNSTPPPPGGAPSISTDNALNVTRTSATLGANVDPNNFPTTIWFEYGQSPDFGNATALQQVGSGSSLLSEVADISGLSPFTKYYFRVNAQNEYGTVNGATNSFTTNGPAPSAPSAKASSASAVTGSSATFNGSVDPNGEDTTYWFEYGTDSILGSILGTTTHTEGIGSGTSFANVSASVANLDSNTNYYYRLVAQNAIGTTRSSIEHFKTATR